MIETLHNPTPERTRQLAEQGFTIDGSGRPLHPWIAERELKLPEQSPLWQWGPNAAADAIVFNTDAPEVLLIKRMDGTWANAGGFIDPTDISKAHAAAREAFEEEGLSLDPTEALPVYEGIVHDSRSSKYSWTTTAAFLWRTSLQLDTLAASDDAQDIRLADLTQVSQEQLSGSHQFLIKQAVEKYGSLLEKLMYFKNRTGDGASVSDGHMAYDKRIVSLPTKELAFVKQYSPAKFTDSDRSARSLLYLQKEANIYKALQGANYNHVPEQTGYYNGTLVMEALLKDTGWGWQHPQQRTKRRQYIEATLHALENLSQVPVPVDTSDVKPSIVSFAEEGWDTYDSDSKQKIVNKLYDYSCTVKNPNLSDAAYRLADQLDNLYARFRGTSYDQLMVMCHHDFRESNFAWHPEQGVKIIDWSWAGPGLKDSDATTLLVDLHKRGANITPYMEHFNKDHALMMIGFWLMHGIWPDGETDVRFQQIHSAVAAYDLLCPRS